MKQGLYVHIPFCKQICHYCDFNKVLLEGQPVDAYIRALSTEGKWRVENGRYHADTFYIGGGTPTALNSEQLQQLFLGLKKAGVHWDEMSEVTVEVNPDGVTDEQLRVLREAGVNRLSIGVQTFDAELLQQIGRTHGAEDVERLIHRVRDQGFNNVSIDLMYALPAQTDEQWRATVEKAISLDPDHISAYGLKIEPKTQFHNWKKAGKLTPMDEDDEADMYEWLIQRLADAGFLQYEISNFSKPNKESRHNLLYWENEPYLALGAGSHGYIGGSRYSNIGPIPHYLKSIEEKKLPTRKSEALSMTEQMEEEMFLGLRLNRGVRADRFREKYGIHMAELYRNVLPELIDDGLVEWRDNHLRLTERGQLLGNEVFEKFLLPKDTHLIR
ncbi:radical SAM family heme chaperone HemW [Geomicrobium sp. JCM 19039]|uniref:radical SAM family heme chaperone HemW n=1 Tax=Geomicrobium sp. JCM 19039 TaxID=1460636 RepID=UPI00045F410F|nr:radical SAM family heme chaperone HemW [Geomicrobium sp. JCM 19039]GAK11450.1 radical SAM protein [Geomicrobium sp. JCM 19039]